MHPSAPVTLRTPTLAEVPIICALIEDHREEGHLLPRTLLDVRDHAARFVVAVQGHHIVACADLAPLSATVAEVRSLVVDREARGAGLGAALIEELRRRARHQGFRSLCAFTSTPDYFIRMGFSAVPRLSITEKAQTDCKVCPLFTDCRQHAVLESLTVPHPSDDTAAAPSSRLQVVRAP